MGKKNRASSKAGKPQSTKKPNSSQKTKGSQDDGIRNKIQGRKIKKKVNTKKEENLDEGLDFGSLIKGVEFENTLLDADRDEENLVASDSEDDSDKQLSCPKKMTITEKENQIVSERKTPFKEKINPVSLKLPIKDSKGRLIQARDISPGAEDEVLKPKEKVVKDKIAYSESEYESESEAEAEAELESNSCPTNKNPEQLSHKSEAYLKLKLEELAQTASNFSYDPESNYKSLKTLKDLSLDKSIQVRKFALLTQLSVFLDAIPGYRIRALTEEEKNARVSKEVQKLRMYEEYLVSSYQSYLKVLNNQFKIASHNPAKYGELRYVVAKCFSELMATHPDFNFSEQLFLFVARRLSTCNQDSVYELCLDATIRLFKEDELGQNSLNMVQALTKSIKNKEYKVAPPTIRLFLHIKFSINVLQANNKDNKGITEKYTGFKRKRKITVDSKLLSEQKERLSKKMKKRAKAQKEINLELREAEAEYTLEERSRVQSELLKNIFVIYFRVLKESTSTLLFPVTLEGLSKFGHLISVDFFSDLLTLLKGVLKNGLVSNRIPSVDSQDEPVIHTSSEELRCQLLCVLTAFKLLSGQGEALNIDLKDFYTHLYILLPVAAHLPDNAFVDSIASARPEDFAVPSIPLLVVDCIDALFFRNRQDRVPLERAAAFFKRILYLSFHFPHKISVRLLTMAKAFVIKYPGILRMFSTDELAGEGQYLEHATDPDQSNPFATSVYELPALLNCHYDPDVRKATQSLLKIALAR